MKKKIGSLFIALLVCNYIWADVTSGIDTFLDEWVEPTYPLICAAVFIIGVLTNLSKFIDNENRDVKGGIKGIALYMGIVLSVGAIYAAIKNISL